MKKQKRVAVLFSSGLDSTYLIYDNLKKGNKVFPFYVDIINNKNKAIVEKQNISLLYNEFVKEFGYELISKPKNISTLQIHTYPNLKFKQIPLWIFNGIFIDENVNEIQIAYVSKDDAIPFIDDIKKTYKSFNWLFYNERPKLVFPLIKEMKEDLIDYLPDNYKQYISSCEDPNIIHRQISKEEINIFDRNQKEKVFYVPCGKCAPCERIIKTNYLYKKLNTVYRDARMIMYNTLKMEIENENNKGGIVSSEIKKIS